MAAPNPSVGSTSPPSSLPGMPGSATTSPTTTSPHSLPAAAAATAQQQLTPAQIKGLLEVRVYS